MGSLLFTIASFVVALGILITVHEFGHFWVARKLGVKVLRFSIGFGTPLLRFRGRAEERGPAQAVGSESDGTVYASETGEGEGTEYVLAAIPLGGYVKMLDEREGVVPEHLLHRTFNRKSLPVRSAIVAAGPLFNFLFAIIAFWLVYVSGDTGAKPLVGEVSADSIAAAAGFQPDDELLAIGEEETPTWESVVYALLTESMAGTSMAVRVRDGAGYERIRLLPGTSLVSLAEDGSLLENLGLKPKRPRLPPVVGELVVGESADKAGLLAGDLIRSIDDIEVDEWSGLVQEIRQRPGQRVVLQIERAGSERTLEMIVGQVEQNGEIIGRIGAAVEVPADLFEAFRTEVRYGPVEAIGRAVGKTWDMSLFMLKIVGRMVSGQVSVNNISGPISIAQTAGKSASYGLAHFLKFLALISISLGVLNLLPVPVLDGGHLLFFLVEAIKGSPLSEEAQLTGQKIGLIILLALMVLAFYVDFQRLLN
jgi:regulator of sigma E protease